MLKNQKTTTFKRITHRKMPVLISVNDDCEIEVPLEMACHGNIDPRLDGLEGVVKSIYDEEAIIETENKEIITIPLFCVKRIEKKLQERCSDSQSKSTSTKKFKKYFGC